MAAKPKNPIRKMRRDLDINQEMFWQSVGVVQSTGSRYENGREIPKPVQNLLDLIYGDAPLTKLAELRGITVAQLLKIEKGGKK